MTIKWPSLRTALIVAGVVGIAIFCFADYIPRFDFAANVRYAAIPYQAACPDTAGLGPSPSGCGGTFPIRWIILALAAFVGVSALKRHK